MDKTFSLSEVKIKLNRLIEDVKQKGDEIIITKNGQPAAVLVPASLYEGWKETKEIKACPDFIEDIKQALKRLENNEPTYSFEEVFGEPL
ncbi:MAG: type II toxin-antitoxin system Phd/YefM family antitoxin [bacterium]|nr:type II toxin-antitoxin system Phd/YefM family antitoxin [bacterium]MBU1918099.1 type II toxin-antitoxin system Phd/YefM family antitoxin [bacterium]